MPQENELMELRGLIHGQYKSLSEFAREIGWSRQKLHRVLSGKMPPSIRDVQDIAEGLKVPFAFIIKFFL